MTLPPRIGRYQILELLGQGAMGVVYRGRDEGLDRDVAVKVIRGESLDEESRVQFLKEARAAARLQHSGIVTVYELGEEAGAPFLAMELLEGQDLQRAMRGGAVADPLRALAVIEQVLSALGHAHARGIVHRDMKPSNVFLHAGGQVKILDFGVARLGEGMTVTGRVVGTPHYMSPEQIRADRVDGRSDLFSTALMFYEMVAGAKAYRPGSAVTIMYQIVHEDADLSRLPATPGGAVLLAVLRRALARDREERYPDAASFRAALAAAVRGPAEASDEPMEVAAPVSDVAPPPARDAPISPDDDVELPYTVSSHEPAPPPGMGMGAMAAAIVVSVAAAGGAIWWWQGRRERLDAPLAHASIGPLPALPPTDSAPPAERSIEPATPPPDVSLSEAGPAPTTPAPPATLTPPTTQAPPTTLPTATVPPSTTRPTLAAAASPVVSPLPMASPRASPPSRPAGPADVQSRLDRADRLFETGHLGAALAEVRAVLRDDPGNTEAKYLAEDIELDLAVEDHLKKARAALARGDRETARQQAEAGLRAKPNESRLKAVLRELERR
jgi:serine/threonine protein kinase